MAPGGKRGNGMSTIETGGAAFPLYDHRGDGQLFMVEIGMTMRQYAAIHLRVPNSGADWLDDMIAEAREMDAAERAMQGLIVGVERPAFDYIAKTAHDMAEEMTDAARSKGLAP